jgi:hypothetical protein
MSNEDSFFVILRELENVLTCFLASSVNISNLNVGTTACAERGAHADVEPAEIRGGRVQGQAAGGG